MKKLRCPRCKKKRRACEGTIVPEKAYRDGVPWAVVDGVKVCPKCVAEARAR